MSKCPDSSEIRLWIDRVRNSHLLVHQGGGWNSQSI